MLQSPVSAMNGAKSLSSKPELASTRRGHVAIVCGVEGFLCPVVLVGDIVGHLQCHRWLQQPSPFFL
eukprot:2211488-Ditylum_brightwellii.AAC.1